MEPNHRVTPCWIPPDPGNWRIPLEAKPFPEEGLLPLLSPPSEEKPPGINVVDLQSITMEELPIVEAPDATKSKTHPIFETTPTIWTKPATHPPEGAP